MVRMSGKLSKEGQDTPRYTLGIEAVISTEKFLWTMFHELVGNPYA